jgi:hypothetical protein
MNITSRNKHWKAVDSLPIFNWKGWLALLGAIIICTAVFSLNALFFSGNILAGILVDTLTIGLVVIIGALSKENVHTFKADREEPVIIDVLGKDSIKCPKCGLPLKIPQRTIGIRKLEQMVEVEQLANGELRRLGLFPCIIDPRCIITCPSCEQSITCIDQFSRHITKR